ncbi:hypothetical protein [Streptomyces sp. A5-4]|uniref:hypothetical protein n=1 Tax=Streptomyces sp. A5-4 TaxID=3384771 RepID=UPI003DA998E9
MESRYLRGRRTNARARTPFGRGRRAILAAATVATGALLAPTALAAVDATPAAAATTSVQVYFSSESTAPGFGPSNGNWYTDPATGLAATPYKLSKQTDLTTTAASGSASSATLARPATRSTPWTA